MRKFVLFALLALGSLPAQAEQPNKGWIKVTQLTPIQGVYVRVLDVNKSTRTAELLVEGAQADTLIYNCSDWTFVNISNNPSKVMAVPVGKESFEALIAAKICLDS